MSDVPTTGFVAAVGVQCLCPARAGVNAAVAAGNHRVRYTRASVGFGSDGQPYVRVGHVVYTEEDAAMEAAHEEALFAAERTGVDAAEVAWSTDKGSLPRVMWQPTYAGHSDVLVGYWAARPGASPDMKESIGYQVVMRAVTCDCMSLRARGIVGRSRELGKRAREEMQGRVEAEKALCLAACSSDRTRSLRFITAEVTRELCQAAVEQRVPKASQ